MSASDARAVQREARRIVVKVGSSTLTENGLLRDDKFGDLAAQIARLFDGGTEVVLRVRAAPAEAD